MLIEINKNDRKVDNTKIDSRIINIERIVEAREEEILYLKKELTELKKIQNNLNVNF